MACTIKDNIIRILDDSGADYTSKQLEYILYFSEFLLAHNIKFHDKDLLPVWVNHLLIFLKRLDRGEILNIDGLELMFVELSLESVVLTRKMLLNINDDYNNSISESEVFLIATHVENIIRLD